AAHHGGAPRQLRPAAVTAVREPVRHRHGRCAGRGRRRRRGVHPARAGTRRRHGGRNIRRRVRGAAGDGGDMRRPVPYVVATAAGVVVIMLAYLVVQPRGGSATGGGEPAIAYGPCQSAPIGITVAVSPEKRDVMNTLASRYN